MPCFQQVKILQTYPLWHMLCCFKPTTQNTLLIHSQFSWTTAILPHISLYFQPISFLLNHIWMEFILFIQRDNDGKIWLNSPFTYNTFLALICSLIFPLCCASFPSTTWHPYQDPEKVERKKQHSRHCHHHSTPLLLSTTSPYTPTSPLPTKDHPNGP